MKANDTESIIPDHEQTKRFITIYIAAQSIPLIAYFFFHIFKLNILSALLLMICFLVISFWIIQNISGYQLVGLRWNISLAKGFVFFSKPIPFVPRQIDSSIFWLGFFVYMFFWIIALIISLFITTPLFSLVCVFGFLSQLINLMMFMRSYKLAKRQSEHETLEILQDEEVNFELVHSDNDIENKSVTTNDGNDEVHTDNENGKTEIKEMNQIPINDKKEDDFDLPTFE